MLISWAATRGFSWIFPHVHSTSTRPLADWLACWIVTRTEAWLREIGWAWCSCTLLGMNIAAPLTNRKITRKSSTPGNSPSERVRPRSSEKLSSWRMFASSSPWTWQICWSLTWNQKCNLRPCVENLSCSSVAIFRILSFPQPKGVTKVLSLEGVVAPCVRIHFLAPVVWLSSSIIKYL